MGVDERCEAAVSRMLEPRQMLPVVLMVARNIKAAERRAQALERLELKGELRHGTIYQVARHCEQIRAQTVYGLNNSFDRDAADRGADVQVADLHNTEPSKRV